MPLQGSSCASLPRALVRYSSTVHLAPFRPGALALWERGGRTGYNEMHGGHKQVRGSSRSCEINMGTVKDLSRSAENWQT